MGSFCASLWNRIRFLSLEAASWISVTLFAVVNAFRRVWLTRPARPWDGEDPQSAWLSQAQMSQVPNNTNFAAPATSALPSILPVALVRPHHGDGWPTSPAEANILSPLSRTTTLCGGSPPPGDHLDRSCTAVSAGGTIHKTVVFTEEPTEFNTSHPEVFCVITALLNRYDRNIKAEDETVDVHPMRISFEHEASPPGWTAHIHPDGMPYFASSSRKHQYLTMEHLWDQDILEEIEQFVERMEDDISKMAKPMPKDVEIVLELKSTEGCQWGYNMVDHHSRCVFWLQPFKDEWLFKEPGAVASPGHLKLFMEKEYWLHCEYFPNHRPVHIAAMDELMAIIVHGIADTMTSLDSTIPYSAEDLRQYLALVKDMKGMIPSGGYSAAISTNVARLLCAFTSARYLNFYGQYCARLTREQSVTGNNHARRSLLVIALSPVLFYVPDTHLRGLEKIWVDGVIAERPWKQFVETLKTEWLDIILNASVLVTANVAFLAIPSVDLGAGMTAAQLASYLSTVTSVGGVILGLILVRQHRAKAKETAHGAALYLHNHTHPSLGLEILAVTYSLPYALLMWGMVTFLLAIALVCFQSANTIQRVMLGTVWTSIGTLVVATVYTGWESTEVVSDSRIGVVLDRWKERIFDCLAGSSVDGVRKQVRRLSLKPFRQPTMRLFMPAMRRFSRWSSAAEQEGLGVGEEKVSNQFMESM